MLILGNSIQRWILGLIVYIALEGVRIDLTGSVQDKYKKQKPFLNG